MDNKFFEFVKTYRDDIVAFFKAFVELIKTLLANNEAE